MPESLEELMKRIAVENDFAGKKYADFIGISPEVTLTYDGGWRADFSCWRCFAEECFFVGDNAEKVYAEIQEEMNWDGDGFEGETAAEALRKMDVICRKFRQKNLMLSGDVDPERGMDDN